MKYGVYIEMMWEAWLTEFETLEAAQAEVKMWRERVPFGHIANVALVQVISEHEEGDSYVAG